MLKKASLLVAATFIAPHAWSTTWTTNIDSATYKSAGTITFNDMGYTGPTAVGANAFQVGSGFDPSRVGQVQTVVTKDPDWLTSDAPKTVIGDLTGTPTYSNGNMDGQVNFYNWAYTTVGGSTFRDMKIDKAGNYFVDKNNMAFQLYTKYEYRDATGVNPDATRNTNINFQPYATSDARGWCGSVLTSDPAALERMAGQVTFDFAFDVYFESGIPGDPGNYSSTQLVPDFAMRSYGEYVVDVTYPNSATSQHFTGQAVENNTNPITGQLDEAWKNQVSFLGAGVVPKMVWVSADSFEADGSQKWVERCNSTTGECAWAWDVTMVAEGTPDAKIHYNVFAGYAFMMRADGTRTLTYVNPEGWSDYAVPGVPEPETYAMMLVGLALIAGTMRKRS